MLLYEIKDISNGRIITKDGGPGSGVEGHKTAEQPGQPSVKKFSGGYSVVEKDGLFLVYHQDRLVGKTASGEKAQAFAKRKGEESQKTEGLETAKKMESLGKRSYRNEKGELQPLNEHSNLQETIAVAKRYAENAKPRGSASRSDLSRSDKNDYSAALEEVQKLKDYAKYVAKKGRD
jgi:hypothetical protein